MNVAIWLSYDGTRYDGWQKQGNTNKTIQGKLESILERFSGRKVEVHGSGRTDAGVHALGQVGNFHLEERVEAAEVMEYLNRYLPEDIMVWKAKEVSPRFHSRLNAVRKTYRYQIEMGSKKDVFQRHYYYGLGCKLNVERMKAASSFLIGTHDFRSFCSNRRIKKSTVRTVERIVFTQADDSRISDSRLSISFTGNGFLQQMVRILTGTLIEVGLGKKQPDEIAEILEAMDRQRAGFTAPPEGLFLEHVEYGDLI